VTIDPGESASHIKHAGPHGSATIRATDCNGPTTVGPGDAEHRRCHHAGIGPDMCGDDMAKRQPTIGAVTDNLAMES